MFNLLLGAAAGVAGNLLTGEDSRVESRSTLTPEQLDLLNKVIGISSRGLSRGATTSGLPAYTPTPSLLSRAFENAGELFGIGQDTIIDVLTKQSKGVPAYRFDPGKTASRWNSDFATPMMNSWRDNVMPVVKESFNIPGMTHSTLASRGVTDSANRFFSESVQPTLWNAYVQGEQNEFVSAENALNRQLSSVEALGQLPAIATSGALQVGQTQLAEQERILAAMRGEESRLFSENNPWLNVAMASIFGGQSVENIGFQGQKGTLGSDILGSMAILDLLSNRKAA